MAKTAKKATKKVAAKTPKSVFYYGDINSRGDKEFDKKEIPFDLIQQLYDLRGKKDEKKFEALCEKSEDKMPRWFNCYDLKEVFKNIGRLEDLNGHYDCQDEIMYGFGFTKAEAKSAYKEAFMEFEGPGESDDWD